MTASELTGRVALITEAGRGIGRATALALAQAGADVAVAARSSVELEQTAALVAAQHHRSVAAVCDVGSDQAVRDAIAHVHRLVGAIDILVNNAAVLEPLGPSATIDPHAWALGLNINLPGTFRLNATVPAQQQLGVVGGVAVPVVAVGPVEGARSSWSTASRMNQARWALGSQSRRSGAAGRAGRGRSQGNCRSWPII